MAIAFGAQAINPTSTTTSVTHAATLSASAADLLALVVMCRDTDDAPISVVGSLNGAFTQAGTTQGAGGGGRSAGIWFFQNSAAGTEIATVTWGGSVRAAINLSRWTGAHLTSVLDQNSGESGGAATAHDCGGITTTGSGLVLSCYNGDGDILTGVAQTGFTALTNHSGVGYDRGYSGYRIVTSSTAEDADITHTNSVNAVGKMASFNEAAAGGHPAGRRLGNAGIREIGRKGTNLFRTYFLPTNGGILAPAWSH